MTCIAWDGQTLAADRLSSFGSKSTTTKIHKVYGSLIGSAGVSVHCAAMIEWFRGGRVEDKFPAFQKDHATSVDVICIEPNGKIHVFQTSHVPILIEDKVMSFGSGSNYALAAMYLGKTASEAVEVAIALDSGCGNGVDTLTLG